MIKLAVFGSPISHSLSPEIHTAFAGQAGLKLEYTRIESPATAFASRFARFAEEGGVGANITLPLKELAFALADDVTDIARQSGAVNTLIKKDGGWQGTNTDGTGLLTDVQLNGFALHGKKVLIIGAGGASKGIVPALIEKQVTHVHICNRTLSRAQLLVENALQQATKANTCKVQLTASGLTGIPSMNFDLVINATSAGLQNKGIAISEHIYANQPFCYDMVYGPSPTPFMLKAKQNKCYTVDGLGMLVGQAAESFRLWTGVSPDVYPVLLALRKKLGIGDT